MPDHPYISRPEYCFWRRSIAGVPAAEVDPVVRAPFRVTRADRVATAGSCFAQHIARHIGKAGFNYFVTETPHPLVAGFAGDHNYGVFSARYGNIYTSRQLLQTFRRAYGLFTPSDDAWPAGDGRVIDPFRPTIQPGGFACLAEFHADRRQHLAAVRRMVEELDVLVFTLGLTETWYCKQDGVVYPVCPGVSGGVFDAAAHGFMNMRVSEVMQDLNETIALVRGHNAAARFILTVSPVPLIATMEDRSVLTSTTYSKSALRAAAEEVAAAHDGVAYFPSYEVITGAYTRGAYFTEGLRDVTEAGVAHVMRLFLRHYADLGDAAAPPAPAAQPPDGVSALEAAVAVLCDEMLLDAPTVSLADKPGVRPEEPAQAVDGARPLVGWLGSG